MLIWSGKGLLIAIVSVVVGILALISTAMLGVRLPKVGVGLIACGGAAFLLSRHEYAQNRSNTLFFLPLWLWGIASAGLGVALTVGLLVLPETPTETKIKLDRVEHSLRDRQAAASHAPLEPLAEKYRVALAAGAKASGGSEKVSVFLEADSEDPAKVTYAALYVRVEDLKKYSDQGKENLVKAALALLAIDFPRVNCYAAARGPILWGVRGSRSTSGSFLTQVSSDDPRFP